MKMKRTALILASALTFVAGGTALAAPAQQDHAKQPAQATPRQHIAIDADHDGTITREEWSKAAMARFARLDTNKDGKLTREEMRQGRFHGRHGRGGWGRGHGWGHGGEHRGGPDFHPGRHQGPDGSPPAPQAPATPPPAK
jgi:hypothetical protein